MPEDTAKQGKHTLEKIVGVLGKTFDEDRLHTAMLLAYAQAVYGVMRKNCVPSPLYRIIYDEANNSVGMEETYGLSLPPQKGSLDISLEDEIFCCNIRDIPLLLEGETGVGKTFAAMKYISTILEKDQYFSYRLSSTAFLNNLFTHFQEGKMVNGMPVISARTDRIENCAAGMVDEINRGDSNETLQLFDNEMHLGGTIHKLGIPIPELAKDANDKEKTTFKPRSDRKKKVFLVCAQNPAGSDDAKFTQTLQLDAAVDNRLLKTYVGNAAPSAGATLWLNESKGKLHEQFLTDFTARVSKYLGIDSSNFSDIKQDWLSVYSWTTEAARTNKPILYSALELSDFMIAVFSGDLIKYYDYEKKVIKSWNDVLKSGIEIKNKLNETEKVKSIHEVIKSFKVPVIFRDIVQIKKIADVLATLKNIKDALRSTDHVQSYLDTKRYVTVREVASATTLLARNKQSKSAASPINAINEILTQYITLTTNYMQEAGYMAASFSLLDPNAGIKKVAVYKSLRETIKQSGGVDCMINEITEQAKLLVSKISASEDLRNVLIARSVGDMMTLCGFMQEYNGEIDAMFKKYNKKSRIPAIVEDLGKFYFAKLSETAMVMPEDYQHRIQRTLGIEN